MLQIIKKKMLIALIEYKLNSIEFNEEIGFAMIYLFIFFQFRLIQIFLHIKILLFPL